MVKLVVLAALCALAISASADYGSLHYVDDILDESSYDGFGILDRIRGSLNRNLDQAETLIKRREDIRVLVSDKIQEIRDKIQSTVDLTGQKVGDVLSQVRRDIISLYKEISEKLKKPPTSSRYDAASQLRELFSQIKKQATTPEGISAIKEYARGLTPTHPLAFLAKAYLEQVSDADLKVIVDELLGGVQYAIEAFGVVYADLGDLVRQARDIARTDEGIAVIQDYFRRNPSTNAIVVRVKNFLLGATNEQIRGVIDVLLSGLDFYSQDYEVYSELGDLFVRIKEIILSSNRALAVIREYAHQKLVSTHSVVVLIRRYLQYSSDDDLKELFTEMFKNIGFFYGNYDEASDLRDLFQQVREIVQAKEGLSIVKLYAENLETQHPIVLRIKAFITNATQDELQEALNALMGGLDF